MSLELTWFAIQTRPGAERVAEQTLSTLDLETLLPFARRKSKGQSLLRPLFPCYLFARLAPRVHLHPVRYSRGVARIVGPPENPWPVEPAIIEGIRERLDVDCAVDLQPHTHRRGDAVRISDGPLAGWDGIFDGEIGDQYRVILLLDAIQQPRALVRRDWLEAAEAV